MQSIFLDISFLRFLLYLKYLVRYAFLILIFLKSKNDFFKRFEKNKIVDFTQYPVSNTSLYNKYLKEHEIHNKPNQYKIERINIDIRLYETLNILSEYINQ